MSQQPQEPIDYNTDLELLLKLHAEECESLSILHRNSYEKYNGRSNYINIPVIILSSAIGFATGIDIGYEKMNIILGVGSIFVGIIKSIDTYFQLGKRAESHRLCSLQFQQINKKIQIELALVRSQRVDAKDMMNIIKTDIKNLFDIAPLIDQDVIEAFQKKYGKLATDDNGHLIQGKYKFDAHTPNLCNGLSIVTINSARNKQDYEERTSRKSSRDGSPSRDNDNNGQNNNNGSGGVTVVIDNASIAKEIQEQQLAKQLTQQLTQPLNPNNQVQMNMLNQQLQQLQQLQHPVVIETIPENSIISGNNFIASAEFVSLPSTKKSTVIPPAYSANRSAPRSISRSPATLQPSVRNSVHQSAAPSVHQSAAPSVHQSAAPSVHQSATPSAHQSVHGDSTPVAVEVHEYEMPIDYAQQPANIALQLTQDQLQQLLQQQEQMMKDLDGQDGEMM